MDFLQQAASADYRDWGLGPPTLDKPFTPLTKALEVGQLALWATSQRFVTDPGGALEDLSARAALGGHLVGFAVIGGSVSPRPRMSHSAGNWAG
jgi:hypothetical protein